MSHNPDFQKEEILAHKKREIARQIAAFNDNPDRPFDSVGGTRVYHHARPPILAEDCDYEIVSISGVQGRRVPA